MSGLSKAGMRSNMPMPMNVERSGLQRLLNGVQGFMSNPLIGTGLNMMTGGLGSLFSTGLNMFTQNWANNRQMDMWNQMNEYNTPDAQMQRFLEAGINPAAAVAAVTGGPNETTEPTMPGNPSQAPDLASLFGNSANAAWDMKVKQMQSREIDANIAVKGLQGEQLAQQTYELRASWNTRLDKMVADGDISKYERDKLEAFAPYQDMIAGLTRDSMQQTYDNLIEEGKRIKSQIRMQNAQAEVSRSTAKQINVETGYREWLTGKLKELGYSEGDPMFSYVMAMNDGRIDDANSILNGIEKVNYVGSRGTATGSDPVNEKLRNEFEAAKSSDDIVRLAEAEYARLTKEVAALAEDPNVSGDAYKEAQKVLDQLGDELYEAKRKRNSSYDMFETSLEHYRGARDPNKWYKEDWFRLGEDVVKFGTQIYAATQMKKIGGTVIQNGNAPTTVPSNVIMSTPNAGPFNTYRGF